MELGRRLFLPRSRRSEFREITMNLERHERTNRMLVCVIESSNIQNLYGRRETAEVETFVSYFLMDFRRSAGVTRRDFSPLLAALSLLMESRDPIGNNLVEWRRCSCPSLFASSFRLPMLISAIRRRSGAQTPGTARFLIEEILIRQRSRCINIRRK